MPVSDWRLHLVPAEWHPPPIGIYFLLLPGLCAILNVSTNVARLAVIPAILGHAAFNTASHLAGLFSSVEMSNSNAFWKVFGTLVEALGAPRFSIPANFVIACCGLAIALLIAAATKGRLAYTPPRPSSPRAMSRNNQNVP
jgi:hypothetical protein